MKTLQHWTLEEDNYGFIRLGLDKQGSALNTLDRAVLDELGQVLDHITPQTSAKGLLLYSKKKTGFIAGADIKSFGNFSDLQAAFDAIRRVHDLFDRFAQLPFPTVACINGVCLGGGVELALACDYRLAIADENTKLGLPEVKLGIHPGWGGTVRLLQRVGSLAGLRLMLTGSVVSAAQAYKLGLVDLLVPRRCAEKAIETLFLKQPKLKSLAFYEYAFKFSSVRRLLTWYLTRDLEKKVNKTAYPAPFAILQQWLTHGNSTTASAFIAEAQSVAQLLFTDTAKQLIRVFFLQERLKGLAKSTHFSEESVNNHLSESSLTLEAEAPDFQHVHVVGAGVMGGDIAAWCALKGFRVTLQDQRIDAIAVAIRRATQLFQKKLKKPHLIQSAMDRLIPDVAGTGIHSAGFIIEAIIEDKKAKQALFQALEQGAKPGAVLASNTSSIPLEEIAEVMQAPSRLVGIHFFNPVAMMPLIEVVKTAHTDLQVLAATFIFCRKIDKLPLPVKSSPGFVVNRILMPYLMEAMRLLQEGFDRQSIDQAAKQFGMPMGPILLADTVGLDVCLSVAQHLASYFSIEIPPQLSQLVEAGHLGKKTGRGFYQYQQGKPVYLKNIRPVSEDTLLSIEKRLIACMLDESKAVLAEQLLDDGDLLDAGMIFGAGFPPFRGGPVTYAKTFVKIPDAFDLQNPVQQDAVVEDVE